MTSLTHSLPQLELNLLSSANLYSSVRSPGSSVLKCKQLNRIEVKKLSTQHLCYSLLHSPAAIDSLTSGGGKGRGGGGWEGGGGGVGGGGRGGRASVGGTLVTRPLGGQQHVPGSPLPHSCCWSSTWYKENTTGSLIEVQSETQQFYWKGKSVSD